MQTIPGSYEIDIPLWKVKSSLSHAFKIAKIHLFEDGKAALHPEDSCFGAVGVSKEYMDKHKPEVSGYYVVYKDGYKSFSPAKAFEEGYTKVD